MAGALKRIVRRCWFSGWPELICAVVCAVFAFEYLDRRDWGMAALSGLGWVLLVVASVRRRYQESLRRITEFEENLRKENRLFRIRK